MTLIHKPKLLQAYIEAFHIDQHFSRDVSDQMHLFYFTPGQYIYQENDALSYFYFFVKGKAKVYSSLSNGKSLLHSFYEPLQVLGDIEVVNQTPVTVNVKVISPVHCIGIHIDFVRRQLLEDTKFLQFLCSDLGKKLNRCSKNSTINLLYPLENRLASYILAIETQEFTCQNSLTFYDSLTEISELLGTSYRHLLRTLTHFVDKGILKKEDKGYLIMDRKPLEAMASDLYSN